MLDSARGMELLSKPEIKTAVVLAGGEGLRLRPLTSDSPKAMIVAARKAAAAMGS